jgi:hypothetical protein
MLRFVFSFFKFFSFIEIKEIMFLNYYGKEMRDLRNCKRSGKSKCIYEVLRSATECCQIKIKNTIRLWRTFWRVKRTCKHACPSASNQFVCAVAI